jgi:acetylornithine deacetylase/succinyl-diaminopimelate desuccinylase-like protein
MQDIQQVIEERKQVYVDWLVRLCQQPSIAAQNVGMVETADLVEELLQGIGAETRRISTSGFPVVYGAVGAGEKTLAFYNHYDVQPPEPLEEWLSDPFAAEIRDGALYARGVADNKGNIVARLAAVDAYVRARGRLAEQLKVKFIIEGEEEIGSIHLDEFAQANRDLVQADGYIWEAGYADPQGRRQIYLGAKGILYAELTARAANVDLHSSWATIVPNPAWRLLHALRSLRDAEGRVLIPGFYDRVRPLTEADRAALQRMPFDEEGYLQQLGLDAFNNHLTGLPLLEQHLFQPTCNICGLWSGYTGEGSKTVLPREAKVKLDFRLVPDQDPGEIADLLTKHLEREGFGDVEAATMEPEHPARTPLDHPFVDLVVETSREVYGQEPVVYPSMAGTGPMYVLCQQFDIPCVSVGVGHSDSRNHAPNENILLEDFYQGILHLAVILERFPTIG